MFPKFIHWRICDSILDRWIRDYLYGWLHSVACNVSCFS